MLILMVTAQAFAKMMNIGILFRNNVKIAMFLIAIIVEDISNALNARKDTHYFLMIKVHSVLNVLNHANIAMLIKVNQVLLELIATYVRTIIS